MRLMKNYFSVKMNFYHLYESDGFNYIEYDFYVFRSAESESEVYLAR